MRRINRLNISLDFIFKTQVTSEKSRRFVCKTKISLPTSLCKCICQECVQEHGHVSTCLQKRVCEVETLACFPPGRLHAHRGASRGNHVRTHLFLQTRSCRSNLQSVVLGLCMGNACFPSHACRTPIKRYTNIKNKTQQGDITD